VQWLGQWGTGGTLLKCLQMCSQQAAERRLDTFGRVGENGRRSLSPSGVEPGPPLRGPRLHPAEPLCRRTEGWT
jgi:hypothetical protein